MASQIIKRPFEAHFKLAGKKGMKSRRYSRLDTALPKAVQILILEGQPKDTVQIASHDFGYEICTITVHVGNGITISYAEDFKV